MGRPKKSTTDSGAVNNPVRLNTQEIVNLERDRIKEVMKTFGKDRSFMIERHLDNVKLNTGEITGEDVGYVINLFMRELVNAI